MLMTQRAPAMMAAALLALVTGCNQTTRSLTPEEARAKGDGMLRQMSQSAAASQTFSFTADEVRERVAANGAKTEARFTRQVTVRRPNALAFTSKGDERDSSAWYDGKFLTIVSHREKVWAKGPMPDTLDAAIDYLSAEYAIQMPTADLLYSSPYDALMTADTTGGWVDVQKVGDRSAEHLSYQQPVVDWEIWLTQDDRRLPIQFQITYKTEPGKPVVRVIYHDLNTSPQVSDDTFAAKIPDGYQRIKIMRHASVVDEKLEGAAATSGPPKPPAKPR
jgi:hypothetical protein